MAATEAFVGEDAAKMDEGAAVEEKELEKLRDPRKWKCSWPFAIRAMDTVAVVALATIQGAALNLMLWKHSGGHGPWLALFLGDIILAAIFTLSSFFSHHRFLKHVHHHLRDIDIPRVQVPMYGVLPFGYIAWFLYAAWLATRVCLLVSTGTAATLSTEVGPLSATALLLALAVSAGVFFLLVNTNSDAPPNSARATYISDLCKGTTFDIVDSVAMLSLLLPEEGGKAPYVTASALVATILVLSCINYFLPTLALMKLSLSDFCERGHPVRLELIYKTCRFLLVDLPYLIIRIYLWQVDRTGAVFVAKNALYVLVSLRYLIPEYVDLVKRRTRKVCDAPVNVNDDCGCNDTTTTT